MFSNNSRGQQQKPGQSAPPKKPQQDSRNGPVDEDKEPEFDFISPEDAWIYQTLLQYVNSPVFSAPILQFLDENCVHFIDTQKVDEDQIKIFKEYQNLLDNMLAIYGDEIGITIDKLKELIQAGLNSQEHQKHFRLHYFYYKQPDFIKHMVKRNLALEQQAFNSMTGNQFQNQGRQQAGSKQKPQQGQQYQAEVDADLDLAIQESLLLDELRKNELQEGNPDQELKDLQAALALSKLESEEREQKIKAREEDELERALKMSQLSAEIQDEVQRKQQSEGIHHFEEEKFNKQAGQQLPSNKGEKDQKEFDTMIFSGRQNLLQQLDQLPPQQQQQQQQQQPQQQQHVETLEEKKARLLKQRQLLLEKKKQQREEEVQEYQSQQGSPRNGSQQQQAPINFSAQGLDQAEIDKRKNQYEKIRQNMQ